MGDELKTTVYHKTVESYTKIGHNEPVIKSKEMTYVDHQKDKVTITPTNFDVSVADDILKSYGYSYEDTMSSAEDDVDVLERQPSKEDGKAAKDLIENKIEQLSIDIDAELHKHNRNFEKLRELVCKVVSVIMHRSKQVNQEYIFDSGVEVKIQAVKVQGTYNTWPGLVITVISSGISLAGGAAGLSPLAPASLIAQGTSSILMQASHSIGLAGQGFGGVGSIFTNKQEGIRFVYQILLEETKKKREDRESARQQNLSSKSDAMSQLNEFLRQIQQLISTILGN